jgi:OPA family sugar phosphate sensor protein UhpC-like MFS transporter
MTRWVDAKKRGSYYGIWSASHNLGEALTFISIAILVSHFSWRSGMIGAGIIGLLYFFVMITFMHDTPQSKGLLLDAKIINKRNKSDEFNNAQKAVLKNPAIWIIALSSAFMYISRYAVNSWGVFYLEAQKGYSTLDSSLIISISSVCGIIGTVCSGIISDKLFNSKRNIPALIFGIMNVVALCLFLLVPGTHFWLDATAMVFFGLAIGVLICFIGGLMAVDFAPRNASGAALGIVGIASYVGAGLQDVMSGLLIEGNKTIVDGVAVYDFTYINWFWIGSAALSAFLALFVWNAKQPEE